MAIRIVPKNKEASATPAGAVDPLPEKDKQQPTRKLPTERIAFPRQLDILRAYALASNGGTKAVHYKTAAEVVKMSSTTVPLMNTFIVDNAFVEKSGNDFIPDRALIEFAQAHSWNPETAAYKLAPLIRSTWFGERILTRLAFKGMSMDDMVADLAAQISAPPDCKAQIEILIEYAIAAGLVKRDGNQLTLGPQASPDGQQTPQSRPEKPMPPEASEVRADPSARTPGAVATGFMTTEGGVQFHVAIKVDMKEMSGWTPDRITAFFSGLAQVLAAKKGTESV